MENSDLNKLPIRINWLGFESDTLTLRREGWKIFASQERQFNQDSLSLMVAARDPSEQIMIQGQLAIPMSTLMQTGRDAQYSLMELALRVGVKAGYYKVRDQAHIYQMDRGFYSSLESLEACDGTLDAEALTERKDLRDLNFFTYKEEAKEIYLPSSSIDDCLNRILEIQKPSMDKIKEAQKSKEVIPAIQAKIYQIAA